MIWAHTPESKVGERIAKEVDKCICDNNENGHTGQLCLTWRGDGEVEPRSGICLGELRGNRQRPRTSEANRGRDQLNSVGVGHVQVQCNSLGNYLLSTATSKRIPPVIGQMSPSVASDASSDGHTFVPLNEDGNTVGAARNNDVSPRDFQRLVVPPLLHYSGSPLSRAGCVPLLSLHLHLFSISSHIPPNLLNAYPLSSDCNLSPLASSTPTQLPRAQAPEASLFITPRMTFAPIPCSCQVSLFLTRGPRYLPACTLDLLHPSCPTVRPL